MSKVNSLFQDEQERRAAEWLKANPGKTEEDAYFALHPDEHVWFPDTLLWSECDGDTP